MLGLVVGLDHNTAFEAHMLNRTALLGISAVADHWRPLSWHSAMPLSTMCMGRSCTSIHRSQCRRVDKGIVQSQDHKQLKCLPR